MVKPISKYNFPRIMMFSHQFYPVVGGAERQCLKLSKALIRIGVNVRVITFKLNPNWPEEETIDGVSIKRLPILAPSEINLPLLLSYFCAIRNSYDIIHLHHANQVACVAAAIIKKIFHKPMIVKFSNSGIRFDFRLARENKRWPMRDMIIRSVLYADKIIAISNTIKSELEKEGVKPSKIVSIPNGVELAKTENIEIVRKMRRRELGLPINACIILRVGTLAPKKGVSLLLESWKNIVKEHPDAFLLSVGGADIPEAISMQLREFKGRVKFLTNRIDGVDPYYEAADIFVLPSFAEGLSNALMEAMAHGLPSVVTDVGGNSEIVQNGKAGIVVRPGDPDSFAQAISKLIENPYMRREMSKEAKNIVAKFDISDIARRYKRLYQDLLRN